jgi:hypothetical protein
MYRSLVLAAAAAFCWGGVANVASAQSFTTHDSVIETCRNVAAAESTVDGASENALRGQCIGATNSYLAYLQNASMTAEAYGAEISALVVDLAKLVVIRNCKEESEIAQAIQFVAAASTDEAQIRQIRLIARTVAGCSFGVTAALRDFEEPGFYEPGGSLIDSSGGTPASLS